MKRRPSRLIVCLAMLVAVVVLAIAAPAGADNYQYTVRVFPGNRGTLASDPVVVKVNPGDNVNLYDIATATITDSKYVQTGFRLSGADSLLGNGQINGIYEDMDYVVAYGVEADAVQYTLHYVEYETGKELAEPRTFYGKAGDKPVAAYDYIEGYRPLYLAITGTLVADQDNDWTFEYVPLAEGETIETTTTNTTTRYVTNEGPGGVIENEVVAGGGADAAATTGAGTATGGTGTGGTAGAGANEGESTAGGAEAAPETQEILDLDTPLAGPGSSNAAGIPGNDAKLLSYPALIAGVAVILAAAVGLIAYLKKLKKAKTNEEAS